LLKWNVSRQSSLQEADSICETCGIVHPINDHCQEMFKQLSVFDLRGALRNAGPKRPYNRARRIEGPKSALVVAFTVLFSDVYEILDTHQKSPVM